MLLKLAFGFAGMRLGIALRTLGRTVPGAKEAFDLADDGAGVQVAERNTLNQAVVRRPAEIGQACGLGIRAIPRPQRRIEG